LVILVDHIFADTNLGQERIVSLGNKPLKIKLFLLNPVGHILSIKLIGLFEGSGTIVGKWVHIMELAGKMVPETGILLRL
jgi:hypothetical protein